MLPYAQQQEIQNYIENISAEEAREILKGYYSALEHYSATNKASIKLSPDERNDYYRSIEIIVRIEALERNKGSIFRAKRRFQLVTKTS